MIKGNRELSSQGTSMSQNEIKLPPLKDGLKQSLLSGQRDLAAIDKTRADKLTQPGWKHECHNKSIQDLSKTLLVSWPIMLEQRPSRRTGKRFGTFYQKWRDKFWPRKRESHLCVQLAIHPELSDEIHQVVQRLLRCCVSFLYLTYEECYPRMNL